MAADCVNLASGGLSELWRLIFGFWLYLSHLTKKGGSKRFWIQECCKIVSRES